MYTSRLTCYWWVFNLLPCLGYGERNCYEHGSTFSGFLLHFLWKYAQKWGHEWFCFQVERNLHSASHSSRTMYLSQWTRVPICAFHHLRWCVIWQSPCWWGFDFHHPADRNAKHLFSLLAILCLLWRKAYSTLYPYFQSVIFLVELFELPMYFGY